MTTLRVRDIDTGETFLDSFPSADAEFHLIMWRLSGRHAIVHMVF